MLDRYIALRQKGLTPAISLKVQRDDQGIIVSRLVVMTWTKYDPETSQVERELTESIDAADLKSLYEYAKLRVQAGEEITAALGFTIH